VWLNHALALLHPQHAAITAVQPALLCPAMQAGRQAQMTKAPNRLWPSRARLESRIGILCLEVPCQIRVTQLLAASAAATDCRL
jgi:hypothetical protein